jgi:hypothetical protein
MKSADISVLYIFWILGEPFSFHKQRLDIRGAKVKDIWIFRFAALFSFVLFDSLTTWISISNLVEEGNSFARMFMESLGITLGLILFVGIISCFLFLILCFCRSMFNGRSGSAVTAGILLLDILLGWFVAGAHFVGGTSWFWIAPDSMRHFLGAGLYLAILYSPRMRFLRSRP